MSHISEVFRKDILFPAFMFLTVVLFSVTSSPRLGVASVQSLEAIPEIAVFAALWYAWFAILLALAVGRKRAHVARSRGFLIASAFGVVVLGFGFSSMATIEVEEFNTLVHLQSLLSFGKVQPHPLQLPYLDFPALHIVLDALTMIGGLTDVGSLVSLKVLLFLFAGGLLYLCHRRWLMHHQPSLEAVIITLMGSAMIVRSTNLTPGFLGFVLLLSFLLAYGINHTGPTRTAGVVVSMLLFAATIAAHMQTGASVAFILLGILLANYRRERQTATVEPAKAQAAIFVIVLTLAWLAYWATHTFGTIVGPIVEALKEIRTGAPLVSLLRVAKANVGTEVPTWASLTLVVWLTLLYALGTVLSLLSVMKAAEKQASASRILGGALAGLLVMLVVMTVVSVRGLEFGLFLRLAPLFSAPVLVAAAHGGSGRFRDRTIIAMLVIVWVLSLPSFLVNHSTLGIEAARDVDMAGARFLARQHRPRDRQAVYASFAVPRLVYTYYLQGEDVWRGEPEFYHWKEPSDLRYWMRTLAEEFLGEGMSESNYRTIFVMSERPRLFYFRLLAIQLSDPAWSEAEAILSKTDLVYNNGDVKMWI